MTAERLRSYRFATEAQWSTCLLVQADRAPAAEGGGLRPYAPYARPPRLYETRGAHAPVVTRAGDILWRDDGCFLHRLTVCDDAPVVSRAPRGMQRAQRVVASASGVWVLSGPQSLERYDDDTMTRALVVDLPDTNLVDIADDGRDAVWILVERQGAWTAEHVDRAGHIVESVELRGIARASQIIFLRRAQRFVILAGKGHPRLYWFAATGGEPLFSLATGGMLPCFTAQVLGSDSRDRVFVAGSDIVECRPGSGIVILDKDGNQVGDVPLDAPATGITGSRDSLLVTGDRGLLRFEASEVVPEGTGRVHCMLMTPMLFSPDREDRRRWLRVEASASLPEGATLAISFAATDDAATRDRLNAIATDDSLPASQRASRLLSEPELWRGPIEFHGSGDRASDPPSPFSAKLFDVSERYLWVCITLDAAPGARLPKLSELAVLYPGRSLMESLPAVYQRAEAEPHAFLRDLVGVLETTTQGLDASIGSMGSRIHPRTAPGAWRDFIARWLGVPWDDGLTSDQKRAILTRAADLAKGRGTRAGLEALLDSLMPGTPRRYRVADPTADVGFATVGGDGCAGSALPAMLGGRTRWSPELDSRAVLGYSRLPCEAQRDDGAWQLAGRVRVDVAASAAERKAWEPWLLALITEMVPLTARVELRWVSARALQTNRLGPDLRLEGPPAPHLGTDAVTGLARLPEGGIRLSASGPDISIRLR